MHATETDVTLWPGDATELPSTDAGPDTDLAVILLAAGQSQSYIRQKCGFGSAREVQAFCRDDEVKRAATELAGERNRRLGRRASVCLEQILQTPQTDLRAQVLAIRTALEVSGDLKRDHGAPTKTVRELSSAELDELIATTRAELDARIARYRAGGGKLPATYPAQSDT